MTSTTILTHSASPYQVELFDRLGASPALDVRVIYRYRGDPDRQWWPPDLRHTHTFVDERAGEGTEADRWISNSDLVVFNWYSDPWSRARIRRRAQADAPWCLWGERPGAAGFGILGTWRRRFSLSALQRTRIPIWGIGEWAVEGWRSEFGNGRSYFNVPYCSDLARFKSSSRNARGRGSRRILFSGSLIRRKGVDLLAEAFARVARDFPDIELFWLGSGKLESELRSRLRAVGEKVRFLGFSSWADLPSFYQKGDVLCAPSRYDGWGLVVPEGLAAGMPVISTERTGSARELIQKGYNGWRIKAGDSAALEQALREATEMDEDGFQRMSSAAADSIKNYTLDKGAEKFVATAQTTFASFDRDGQ